MDVRTCVRQCATATERMNSMQLVVGRSTVCLSVGLLFVGWRQALLAAAIGAFFWWNAKHDMRKWAAAGGIMGYYGIAEEKDGVEEED